MGEEQRSRIVFDEVADVYHEVRPRYPTALFSSLVQVTNLHPGAELLEIGPGTGQATEDLAKRGFEILGIELGPRLAVLARRNLSRYSNVQIVTGAFEEVGLLNEAFDLVYAATSFHWIDPSFRFSKPNKVLKPYGHLAIIRTHHVWGELNDVFFEKSRPIYDKFLPTDDPNSYISSESKIKPYEFDESLFEPNFFGTFPTTINYSSEEYIKLVNTFSPTRDMDPRARVLFLRAIKDLVDEQFYGVVAKEFAMTLDVARKK